MTLQIFFALIFIFAFGFLLYAGPSYFRRLRVFIDLLERGHRSTFEMLHEPDLAFANVTIRSAFAVATYVIRRGYVVLQDEALTDLGDAVRWRLIASLVTVLSITIVVPLASIVMS